MQSHSRSKAVVGKSRLAAYAAACTSVLAGAHQAEAGITHVLVNELIEDLTVGGDAIGTDLLFGATPHHLALAHGLGPTDAATGYAFLISNAFGIPGVDGVAGFVASYNYVTNVAYNAAISGLAFLTAAQVAGPTGATLAYNAYPYGEFLSAGIGFIGVKFNVNQYGWVRVDMGGAPLNRFTVVDYAYAGPGEPIRAGEVPEPSSLAALALGAIGIASWRKSRRKQPA